METLDEARDFWQNTNQEPNHASIVKEDLEMVIKARIKKEKENAAGYFWPAFTLQILIYSFACHLTLKYWGDSLVMLLSLVGVLLYIPLTVILMRKFKAICKPVAGSNLDMYNNVKQQSELLNQFFSFKKNFDLVSIPLSSIILAVILVTLYLPGGVENHLEGAIISCLAMMLIYSTAAWFENKKHFVKPLCRLNFILEDMRNPT